MIAAVLAIAGLVYLTWLHLQNQKVARAERATFFDDCRGVLTDERAGFDRFGYPVLVGTWRGLAVTAEAVVDTMAVRKLPVLWLRLNIHTPLPLDTKTDVMMRPLGTEFYSIHHDLDYRVDTPAGWPEAAIIRADSPDIGELLDCLSQHLDLLREDDAKELFAGPNGIRLVWRIDEASRADFALLRQARFEKPSVECGVLHRMLDWSERLVSDIRGMAQPQTMPKLKHDNAA